MFLTTHDLAGVERIADRVAVLRDGRLLLAEELEPLKERYRRRAASPLEVVPLTLEEIFVSLHDTPAEVYP